METKHLCDSCNKEVSEDNGGWVVSAIGEKFFCDPCLNIECDGWEDERELDDPLAYREEF